MLDVAEIKRRLMCHEDNFVERKSKRIGYQQFCKTIVAFANTLQEEQYGILVIGISDTGKIEGVDNPDKVQKDVQKWSQDICYPPIDCKSVVVNDSEGDVVAVVVGFSKNRPHFSGHAYVRKGSTSVSASPEMFKELIASQNDKTQRILKDKGYLVSVLLSSRNQPIECKVTGCDAHCVSLQNNSTDQSLTFPLDDVKISRDEAIYRTLLKINDS